jgi:hypothetical protein
MDKKVQCNIAHPFEESSCKSSHAFGSRNKAVMESSSFEEYKDRKAVRSGSEVYALCIEKWILELEGISQDLHTQGSDYAEVRY